MIISSLLMIRLSYLQIAETDKKVTYKSLQKLSYLQIPAIDRKYSQNILDKDFYKYMICRNRRKQSLVQEPFIILRFNAPHYL